jgi:hypothetical protein
VKIYFNPSQILDRGLIVLEFKITSEDPDKNKKQKIAFKKFLTED